VIAQIEKKAKRVLRKPNCCYLARTVIKKFSNFFLQNLRTHKTQFKIDKNKMVGMRNETIISMRFVRSKLRKREESSHINTTSESTQQQQIVSTVEPVFRQSPSNNVWHFPPLPPQPNLYIYNASSQVSIHFHFNLL
jgi:hypothetical protein